MYSAREPSRELAEQREIYRAIGRLEKTVAAVVTALDYMKRDIRHPQAWKTGHMRDLLKRTTRQYPAAAT
jgi:hypothetical protein